jgi:hypothetical protein
MEKSSSKRRNKMNTRRESKTGSIGTQTSEPAVKTDGRHKTITATSVTKDGSDRIHKRICNYKHFIEDYDAFLVRMWQEKLASKLSEVLLLENPFSQSRV